jgi:hypothetical protein
LIVGVFGVLLLHLRIHSQILMKTGRAVPPKNLKMNIPVKRFMMFNSIIMQKNILIPKKLNTIYKM